MSLARFLLPGRGDDGLKHLRSVHKDRGLEDRAVLENISYIGVSHLSVEINFNDGSTIRVTANKFTDGIKVEER